MGTEQFWAGDFGDEYTARNRVDWRRRVPFWREIIEFTGARSVYEFGCNAGFNLSAIKRSSPDTAVAGEDVNQTASAQAAAAGLSVDISGLSLEPFNEYDLAFTSGVLIHIAPEDLREMMEKVVDASADYVLAIEYAADKEEEVLYRGHAGKLWRRPFGKLYQDMGLKMVMEASAGDGFDNCTAWLLRK